MRGIGNTLKRCVEREGDAGQRDREQFDGYDDAEEDFRIRLHLIFVCNLDLCRGSPGDEDYSRWRLAGVGVQAGDEILRIGVGSLIGVAPPSRRHEPAELRGFEAHFGERRGLRLYECARSG